MNELWPSNVRAFQVPVSSDIIMAVVAAFKAGVVNVRVLKFIAWHLRLISKRKTSFILAFISYNSFHMTIFHKIQYIGRAI